MQPGRCDCAPAGSADKDYKAKYRSLIFNLRDAANPDLRRRVLLGDIPPDKLVHYSANELASKVSSGPLLVPRLRPALLTLRRELHWKPGGLAFPRLGWS